MYIPRHCVSGPSAVLSYTSQLREDQKNQEKAYLQTLFFSPNKSW